VRDGDATVSGSFLLTIEAADPPVPPAELRLSFAYSRDEGLIIRWPSGRDAVLETCNDFEGEWSAVSATEEVAGETIFRVGESGGASGFFRLHFPDQRVP
jgi:hypothetical protein